MKKLFDFLKRRSWVLILIVIVMAVIGDALLTQRQKPVSTPTPVPKTASYNSVFPGTGTELDLTKILGNPLLRSMNGNQTILEYSSTNVYRHQIAIIENSKLALFKEIVNSTDNKGIDSVISVYGSPPYTLYNKSSNVSFSLYVYPSNGIAYLAHTDGTLIEVWYFVPTTIDDFINKWGQDYQLSIPTPNQKGY